MGRHSAVNRRSVIVPQRLKHVNVVRSNKETREAKRLTLARGAKPMAYNKYKDVWKVSATGKKTFAGVQKVSPNEARRAAVKGARKFEFGLSLARKRTPKKTFGGKLKRLF